MESYKIYLAGPLFTTAERDFNAALAAILRKRHEVWVPQEAEQDEMSPREIFMEDVRGLDWAEVVVANMDGPDPDSGTCWECGYARGKGKWVVAFRTDFRVAYEIRSDLQLAKDREKAPYNPMLTESADVRLDQPKRSVAEVADLIEQALSRLASLGSPGQTTLVLTAPLESSPQDRETKTL